MALDISDRPTTDGPGPVRSREMCSRKSGFVDSSYSTSEAPAI